MVRVEDLKITLAPIGPGSTVRVKWTKTLITEHEQTFPLAQLLATVNRERAEPIDTDTDSNEFARALSFSDPSVLRLLAGARNDVGEHGRTFLSERSVSDWTVHAPGTAAPTVPADDAATP